MNEALAAALGVLEVISPTQVRVADEVVEANSPRALVPALGAALYSGLHVGQPYDASVRPNSRDLPLEALFAAVVPHDRTPLRAAVQERGADEYVVELSGVRVRVPVTRIGAPSVDGTVAVALNPARPVLSPGFFLVDGSAGTIHGGGPILRVYLHLGAADEAPEALRTALGELEARGVPYRAKILSRRESYPRRDAMVVYLEEAGWSVLDSLVAALAGRPGVVDDVSPFAHRVGSGVALAWDPADTRAGFRGLSFGEHRGRAVAEGVIAHAVTGEPLAATVAAALVRAGVDPAAPFRNTSSPRLPA